MFRKLVSCAAALALVIGVSGSLFAADAKPKKTVEDRFKALDKNSDGKISLEEYVGNKKGDAAEKIKVAFKAKDKDNDGSLTLDEYKAKPAKTPKTK